MTEYGKTDEAKERTIEVLPVALFALVILELTALIGQHMERGAASFFEAPASPVARIVGMPVRSLGLPGAYLLMGSLLTLVVVWWVKKSVDHAERRAIGLPLLLLSLAGLASLMEGQGVIWGGRFGESLRVFFLMVLPHGLAIVLALGLFAFALILARDWFFFDRLKDWIQRSTGEAFALGVPGGGGARVAPEKKSDDARPTAQRSELSGLDLRPYEDEVRPVTPVNRIQAPRGTDTTEEKAVNLTEDMAREDVKVEESITAEVPIELQDFAAGLDTEDRELEELAHALNLPPSEDEPFQKASQSGAAAMEPQADSSPPAPAYGSAFGPPTWAHEDGSLEDDEEDVDDEAQEDEFEDAYEEDPELLGALSAEERLDGESDDDGENEPDIEDFADTEYQEDEFEDAYEEDSKDHVEFPTEDRLEGESDDDGESEADLEDFADTEYDEDEFEDAHEEDPEVLVEISADDRLDEVPEDSEDLDVAWADLGEEDLASEGDESPIEDDERPSAVQSHLFDAEDNVELLDSEAGDDDEPSLSQDEEAPTLRSRHDELDWAPWDETPRWSSVPPTRFEGRGAPASGPGAIPVYDQAVELCLERDACSVSLLQRELGLDFRTSASLIERMEAEGLVGPYRGTGRREILGSLEEWRRRPTP